MNSGSGNSWLLAGTEGDHFPTPWDHRTADLEADPPAPPPLAGSLGSAIYSSPMESMGLISLVSSQSIWRLPFHDVQAA